MLIGGILMKTGIKVSSFKPVLRTEQEVTVAFEKMAAMGCGSVQIQWIDPSVPVGKDDSENVEVTKYGEPVVPDFEIPYNSLNHSKMRVRQGGLYMQLRLNILSNLNVNIGGRMSSVFASL